MQRRHAIFILSIDRLALACHGPDCQAATPSSLPESKQRRAAKGFQRTITANTNITFGGAPSHGKVASASRIRRFEASSFSSRSAISVKNHPNESI
jgi:hypothetical protein